MPKSKPLNAAHINLVGPLLYGSHWKTELAAALGVTLKSVSQWSLGNATPRRRHTPRIEALLDARMSDLRAAEEALHADLPAPKKPSGKRARLNKIKADDGLDDGARRALNDLNKMWDWDK